MDWLQTLTRRITFLLIINLTLMLALLPIGLQADGSEGVFVVIMAFGICLLANLPSLFFTNHFRSPQAAIFQMALSWGFRMGLPLAVCVVVTYQQNWLFDAGLVYYLMAFYFVMMIQETVSQVIYLKAEQPAATEVK
ncbi:MAG: hypothetical protein VX644_01910 [Planctomycetota bacterium]|nr:hypothetical protein [Planctomycetota bacterium]